MPHRNQRTQKSLHGFNSLLLGKFDPAADTVTAGSSLVFLSFVLCSAAEARLSERKTQYESGEWAVWDRQQIRCLGLMDMKHSHRAVLRETQQNETEEKSREQSSRMLSSFNWSRWKRRDKEGLGK